LNDEPGAIAGEPQKSPGIRYEAQEELMTELVEVYARARSLLAALADTADRGDAAAGYDQVLLTLDTIRPAPRRALIKLDLPDGGRPQLYRQARDTLAELAVEGVDLLEVGVCRNMLATVWEREQPT
jgi:hypothetical protein